MSHRQHIVYKLIGSKLYFRYQDNRHSIKAGLFGLGTLFLFPVILLIAEMF